MKHFLIVLQFALLSSPLLFSQVRWDFLWEGKARDCYVHLPQSRGDQAGLPVVFNLYGYGGSYNEARKFHHSHILGDSVGFITIYPDAFDKRWNSGLGDNPDWPTPNVDDVGFISLIIDSLISRYKIDTARVYVCGGSNGGFMSIKLAGQLGNRITAVASVSGVVTNSTATLYNTTRPVPALTIHGTGDNLLPYNGGLIGLFSVDSTIEFLRSKNSCLLPAEVTSIPDINQNDQSTVVKYIYRSSTNTSQVVHYKVIGGGHEWPGSPTYFGATVINRDIDAIKEIWNFFKQFPASNAALSTFTHNASIDRSIYRPGYDSISLKVILVNPEKHNVAISAILKDSVGVIRDSIFMYNDGLHNDGSSGDNVWGCRFLAPTDENVFTIIVRTDDLTQGNYHLLPKAIRFSTDYMTQVNHSQGNGDGIVIVKVVEPFQKTDHLYRVTINDSSYSSKVYSVFDMTLGGTVKVMNANQFDGITPGPLFDGLRLVVGDVVKIGADTKKTKWVIGSSNLEGRPYLFEGVIGSTTVIARALPYDYTITLNNSVIDTSVAIYEIPAAFMKFQVKNVTKNRKTKVLFMDGDGNNTISSYDEVHILEPDSTGKLALSWGIAFYPSTPIVQPVVGDQFYFKSLKPFTSADVFEFSLKLTSVAYNATLTDYYLAQNYPNPFNPTTVISYQLPVISKVSLKIYDLLGREIATLVNEEQSAGWKEVEWNASKFASGMYLVRMAAGNFNETKKILLMK